MINGYEIGADHYITKPFSPALLKAQIVSILDRRNVLREKGSPNRKAICAAACFVLTKNAISFQNDQPIKLSSKEIMLMRFSWKIQIKCSRKNRFTAMSGKMANSMPIP